MGNLEREEDNHQNRHDRDGGLGPRVWICRVDELDSHQASIDGHQDTWGCEPEGSGEAELVRARASQCVEDCECTGDGLGRGYDAEDSMVGMERGAGNDDDDDGGDGEDDHEPLGQLSLNGRTTWPEGVKAQHEGNKAGLLFWFRRRACGDACAGKCRGRNEDKDKEMGEVEREREKVCACVVCLGVNMALCTMACEREGRLGECGSR